MIDKPGTDISKSKLVVIIRYFHLGVKGFEVIHSNDGYADKNWIFWDSIATRLFSIPEKLTTELLLFS